MTTEFTPQVKKLEGGIFIDTIYNVIDVVDEKITDTDLKQLINEKLFNIIKLMELSCNEVN